MMSEAREVYGLPPSHHHPPSGSRDLHSPLGSPHRGLSEDTMTFQDPSPLQPYVPHLDPLSPPPPAPGHVRNQWANGGVRSAGFVGEKVFSRDTVTTRVPATLLNRNGEWSTGGPSSLDRSLDGVCAVGSSPPQAMTVHHVEVYPCRDVIHPSYHPDQMSPVYPLSLGGPSGVVVPETDNNLQGVRETYHDLHNMGPEDLTSSLRDIVTGDIVRDASLLSYPPFPDPMSISWLDTDSEQDKGRAFPDTGFKLDRDETFPDRRRKEDSDGRFPDMTFHQDREPLQSDLKALQDMDYDFVVMAEPQQQPPPAFSPRAAEQEWEALLQQKDEGEEREKLGTYGVENTGMHGLEEILRVCAEYQQEEESSTTRGNKPGKKLSASARFPPSSTTYIGKSSAISVPSSSSSSSSARLPPVFPSYAAPQQFGRMVPTPNFQDLSPAQPRAPRFMDTIQPVPYSSHVVPYSQTSLIRQNTPAVPDDPKRSAPFPSAGTFPSAYSSIQPKEPFSGAGVTELHSGFSSVENYPGMTSSEGRPGVRKIKTNGSLMLTSPGSSHKATPFMSHMTMSESSCVPPDPSRTLSPQQASHMNKARGLPHSSEHPTQRLYLQDASGLNRTFGPPSMSEPHTPPCLQRAPDHLAPGPQTSPFQRTGFQTSGPQPSALQTGLLQKSESQVQGPQTSIPSMPTHQMSVPERLEHKPPGVDLSGCKTPRSQKPAIQPLQVTWKKPETGSGDPETSSLLEEVLSACHMSDSAPFPWEEETQSSATNSVSPGTDSASFSRDDGDNSASDNVFIQDQGNTATGEAVLEPRGMQVSVPDLGTGTSSLSTSDLKDTSSDKLSSIDDRSHPDFPSSTISSNNTYQTNKETTFVSFNVPPRQDRSTDRGYSQKEMSSLWSDRGPSADEHKASDSQKTSGFRFLPGQKQSEKYQTLPRQTHTSQIAQSPSCDTDKGPRKFNTFPKFRFPKRKKSSEDDAAKLLLRDAEEKTTPKKFVQFNKTDSPVHPEKEKKKVEDNDDQNNDFQNIARKHPQNERITTELEDVNQNDLFEGDKDDPQPIPDKDVDLLDGDMIFNQCKGLYFPTNQDSSSSTSTDFDSSRSSVSSECTLHDNGIDEDDKKDEGGRKEKKRGVQWRVEEESSKESRWQERGGDLEWDQGERERGNADVWVESPTSEGLTLREGRELSQRLDSLKQTKWKLLKKIAKLKLHISDIETREDDIIKQLQEERQAVTGVQSRRGRERGREGPAGQQEEITHRPYSLPPDTHRAQEKGRLTEVQDSIMELSRLLSRLPPSHVEVDVDVDGDADDDVGVGVDVDTDVDQFSDSSTSLGSSSLKIEGSFELATEDGRALRDPQRQDDHGRSVTSLDSEGCSLTSSGDSLDNSGEEKVDKVAELERLLAQAQSDKQQLVQEQERLRLWEMAALSKERQRTEALERELRAVRLREKTEHQARPLTRFLPNSNQQLDLRQHVERSGHHLDNCPQVMVTSQSCRGFLHKMGGRIKTWKKRWFVIDRSKRQVVYYTDQTESKVKGAVSFQHIQDVYADHLRTVKSPNPPLTFCMKTSQRTYYLVAPTPECMSLWIDVIFSGAEGYAQF